MRNEQLLQTLQRLRHALESDIRPEDLHQFAACVDDLGYDSFGLDKLGLSFEQLTAEIQAAYKVYLQQQPKDAVARNNLGVFLANQREFEEARQHFERALEIDQEDATIHRNLQVVDILTGKPKDQWHEVPDVGRGTATLSVYFDAHGM